MTLLLKHCAKNAYGLFSTGFDLEKKCKQMIIFFIVFLTVINIIGLFKCKYTDEKKFNQ